MSVRSITYIRIKLCYVVDCNGARGNCYLASGKGDKESEQQSTTCTWGVHGEEEEEE